MSASPEPAVGVSSFDDLVEEGRNATFAGWDFTTFGDRYSEEACSWNYRTIVQHHLATAHAVVDMGTGGGEFLSSLANVPTDTGATEAYPPNVAVARAALEPLGITVSEVSGDAALPYGDDRFDLVINRHESFVASEVRRILRPGGFFVTQQVGGRDLADLNDALEAPPHAHAAWDPAAAVRSLEDAGLRVLDQREERVPTTFSDVGALVWFLRVVDWQVPDFTVNRYRNQLRRLHTQMAGGTPVTVHAHRFLVVATHDN